MTPNRWRQIEQLYHSVLKREPGLRAAFLDEACAGDDQLRREVGSQLPQLFDRLRDEARFQKLVRRMGLALPSRQDTVHGI
jgi:hypothetical protein